jgi:hypothetical protein
VRTSSKGARLLSWRATTGRGDVTRIAAVLHAPSAEQVAQVHPGAVLGLRGRARPVVEGGAAVLLLHVEEIAWARGATIETGRELYL